MIEKINECLTPFKIVVLYTLATLALQHPGMSGPAVGSYWLR